MTPTTASFEPAHPRRAPRRRGDPSGTRPGRVHRGVARRPVRPVLGSYPDPRGRRREVIARAGAAGSVLVLDRDADTRGDVRLLAHLAADEPSENAALVCRRYLEDGSAHRYRCPRLTPSDLLDEPFPAATSAEPVDEQGGRGRLLDGDGRAYALEPRRGSMSIPELRWRRHDPAPQMDGSETVSVREVVARLESYQPVCGMTLASLRKYEPDPGVSTRRCTWSSPGCTAARSCSTGGCGRPRSRRPSSSS